MGGVGADAGNGGTPGGGEGGEGGDATLGTGEVTPQDGGTVTLGTTTVVVPPGAFEEGIRDVTIRIDDGKEYARSFPYRLVGPEGQDDGDRAFPRGGR